MEDALPYLFPKKIIIPYKNDQKVLVINDIIYFEVYKHEITFHLNSAISIKTNGTLADYINKISAPNFVQIHKSYCINLNYVDRTDKQDIIMTNGDKLSLSRKHKEHFHQCLRNFLKG